jgi:hypothetical protein
MPWHEGLDPNAYHSLGADTTLLSQPPVLKARQLELAAHAAPMVAALPMIWPMSNPCVSFQRFKVNPATVGQAAAEGRAAVEAGPAADGVSRLTRTQTAK